MKLAEIDKRRLVYFLERALAQEEAIEIHVVGQGYELRCGDLDPLFLEPERRAG